jgi:uncharacterized membrane protein YkvA (DUF1232 family)
MAAKKATKKSSGKPVSSKAISKTIDKTEDAMVAMKKHIDKHHPGYRRRPLAGVWSFIMWIVGVLVTLAVGSGMTSGVLPIPLIPDVVTAVAGWIVIVLVLLGVVLKIIDAVSR